MITKADADAFCRKLNARLTAAPDMAVVVVTLSSDGGRQVVTLNCESDWIDGAIEALKARLMTLGGTG